MPFLRRTEPAAEAARPPPPGVWIPWRTAILVGNVGPPACDRRAEAFQIPARGLAGLLMLTLCFRNLAECCPCPLHHRGAFGLGQRASVNGEFEEVAQSNDEVRHNPRGPTVLTALERFLPQTR